MPFTVEIFLLAVLGSLVGSMINWAIYQWAITQHRPISPWMKPRPDLVGAEDAAKLNALEPRTFRDFIPVFGWFRLRRDASTVEEWKGLWIRPLLVEIAWIVGLPLFYWWQTHGGLIDLDPFTSLGATDASPTGRFAGFAQTWFWLHASLIALMFIATFIDFDERMIPDYVTVPGTILALLVSVIFVNSRLPFVVPSMTPGVFELEIIDFATPAKPGPWYLGTSGLLTCLAIYATWIWGLLPKTIPSGDFRLGIFGWVKMILASIVRPPRKGQCDIRISSRQMHFMTKAYFGLLVLGCVVISVGWGMIGAPQKLGLVSSFLGLAIAGGLIWGIRIVGSYMLAQEAMGFGDVTLMCMVGAVIGWQASLVGFVYSIVFAMVGVVILLISRSENHLPFGPYLCMGSLLALLRWPSVLTEFGVFFKMGPFLLLAFGGSLILMAFLLPMVRWIKETALGVETE